ncbi:reverse transcriptase domain-containing protein [Tanacetum coccineum]
MAVWCKMFRQTLGGAARNWFDDLDLRSVDNFEELSQKFLEEFSQQKRYAKDPTMIHGIKRRQKEGLQAFMDRFKFESSHIKGVPPVLRFSAFMHGHGHPELTKKLNDKIPKTWDKGNVCPTWSGGPEKAKNRGGPRETRRNMGIYTPYPRKDTFTPLTKTLKELLAMESVSFPKPPPLIGTPEKQNLNKFCDYHKDRGHNTNDCYQLKKQIEEAVASGKLGHLVKDIRQNNQRNGSQGRNNVKVINMIRGGINRMRPFEGKRSGLTDELTFPAILLNRLTDEPIILEVMIEDHQAKKVQISVDRFLKRNIPPFGDNRPSSNYGRDRKEQNNADGVCDSKVSFAVKRHNRKDLNEKPGVAARKGARFIEGDAVASTQIRMAENDEEKIGFHTEEGVYYFTHMPKGLKNSAATLQRMMEKVLADQKGQNLEVYLEEIVVKSKSEQSLVQDVKETLRKLKRVNIKIDPNTSSFGVEEGRFLGHVVTKEGVRADPEKVQTIIRSPTPKGPNQI